MNRRGVDAGERLAIQLDIEWPTFVPDGHVAMAGCEIRYEIMLNV